MADEGVTRLTTISDLFRVVTKENLNTLAQDLGNVLYFYLIEKDIAEKIREEEIEKFGEAKTPICGLSLGATRTLQFTREGYGKQNFSLPSGSLYVMRPPTNQKWLHAIIRESKILTSRISLTFRQI